MGKKRRKQNEEHVQVAVSKEENINSSKSLPESNILVSNKDGTSIKRKKSKKHTCNNELDISLDNKGEKSSDAINGSKKMITDILITPSKSLIPELNNSTSKKPKKKKHNMQEQEVVHIKSGEEKGIDDSKKSRKKHNRIIVQDINEENSLQKTQAESIKISKSSSSKKKQKLNIVLNDEDSPNKISKVCNNKDKTQNDNNIKDTEKRKQNKQEEVVESEGANKDSKKSKKKRKRKIIEEQVINDEDIDKYCDELDPSYNKQYEDWVKLIEANLNENKKTKK